MAKLGDVDWPALWDKIADFGNGLTKRDLLDDLDTLLKSGADIASAGGASLNEAWMNSGKIGEYFKNNPEKVLELLEQHRSIFEKYANIENIRGMVMQELQSTGRDALNRLFQPDNYNIANYISNYLDGLKDTYYKQRWHIDLVDQGSEVVANYTPEVPEYNRFSKDYNWPDWLNIDAANMAGRALWWDFSFSSYSPDKTDQHYAYYAYTDTEYDAMREIAIEKAWQSTGVYNSEADYLSKNPGRELNYVFNTLHVDQSVWAGGSILHPEFKSVCHYAVSVKITATWDIHKVQYCKIFDSQTMDVRAMEEEFKNKKTEIDLGLTDDNPNHKYKTEFIKDERVYYDVADAERIKGVNKVNFVLSCANNSPLVNGKLTWKENGPERNPLDDNAMIYAMERNHGKLNTTELDDVLANLKQQQTTIKNEIATLQKQSDELRRQIVAATAADSQQLIDQRQKIQESIDDYEKKLAEVNSQLAAAQEALDEMKADYDDDLSKEPDRIPKIMDMLTSSFGIEWMDEGSWGVNNGTNCTFTRHGKMPNLDGIFTFEAVLGYTRSERHFLGIRYHRAILTVDWKIDADYESSDVVDQMDLDSSLTEEQNAEIVNRRIQEIMAENPGCGVKAEYERTNPPAEVEDDSEALHLLWVSDRLAIAREVEARLVKIYAQLMSAEKFLRQELTIKNWLNKTTGLDLSRVQHGRIARKMYNRWINRPKALARGMSLQEVMRLKDEDEE